MIEVINRRRVMAIGAVATLAVAGFSLKAEAGTEDQAKAMVAKAIALYDEKGDAAFKVFGEGKASGFLEGDVYIVVQSRGPEGKVLAHAANAKLDGVMLDTIADPSGKKFGTLMSAEATEAGGWFDYEWPDPSTGKLGDKKSWAVLHKDLVFIAGFYVH
ncbi:cache domain-containing protein [Aestuariivirga sp.]|uniref:cache domain-containing protein n=1 Tax=Aestuariivirga sp. TaxID=2650926 RepID=UPI0030159751